MRIEDVPSLLGLIIEAVGIGLVAVLSFSLTRSLNRVYLKYWTIGWVLLAAALLALLASFRFPAARLRLEPFYYFGEYLFGWLLILGCRNYATDRPVRRRDLWIALPALGLALVLPRISPSFTTRFIPQAAAMAILFAVAFWQVEQARRRKGSGAGLRIMSVALALLTIDFLQYVPVLASGAFFGVTLPAIYREHTSLYDLFFEILLGFGTVTLAMDDARREVEAANRELRATQHRLETLARVDPLTESLNRHAFYSLVEGARNSPVFPTGCVAIVDVDSLKQVNDSYGHAAGDDAIRAVARAIRSVVRADDPVFRWGGDEFLVLLFGVSEDETRRRLDGLNASLHGIPLTGAPSSVVVSVSYGCAAFAESIPMDKAIEMADDAMYRAKQEGKAAREASTPAPAQRG